MMAVFTKPVAAVRYEIRKKAQTCACAKWWDVMIRLIPYERSWTPVGPILLVETYCGPVSQPALKETR